MQMKVWFVPSALAAVSILLTVMLAELPATALAQSNEPIFELPVQLVGFPVIILAVRLSNFVKKLSYSLSPQTYRSRSRRSAEDHHHLALPAFNGSRSAANVAFAEKQIVTVLGPKACVLEEPCRLHATRPQNRDESADWTELLKNYKIQKSGVKHWYLLSVFLGEELRDVGLCKRLAKRLNCNRT